MTALADRQKEFCSYFMPAYPMRSAAVFGGNATQENLCQPVTAGAKDHGSDGTLQWRVERLTGPDGLQPWCAAQGIPWDTLKSQALFTMHELDQPQYAALKADLHAGAKSLETLTLNFCDAFERPSAAGRVPTDRIRYAHDCLAILMRDVPVASVPAPVPAPLPIPVTTVEDLQMPIELILQIIAPIALNFASGLLKGVLTHVQTNGVTPSPLHPAGVPATAPPAPAMPAIDLASLEPIIARLIAAEIAKIGKPA